jgi:hypothetical protein
MRFHLNKKLKEKSYMTVTLPNWNFIQGKKSVGEVILQNSTRKKRVNHNWSILVI